MSSTRKPFYQKLITLLIVFVMIGGVGFTPANAARYTGTPQSVIVQAASAEQAAQLVTRFGGEVTSHLDIIQGVGARVPADALAALRAEPGIVRVTANADTLLAEANFDKKCGNTPDTDYPEVTGADLAWEQGQMGDGVSVAVIDTGRR